MNVGITGDVRVALLDQLTFLRESMTHVLEANGCRVVLSASSVEQCIQHLEQARPAILVADLTSGAWPVLDHVRRWYGDTKIVALTDGADPAARERCEQSGVWACLDKGSMSSQLLVQAVLAAANGRRDVSSLLPSQPPPERPVALGLLTSRELEVLRCIAVGADNLKIAALLGITERTVRAHVSSLYKKLGPENRAQLALLARKLGVAPAAEV